MLTHLPLNVWASGRPGKGGPAASPLQRFHQLDGEHTIENRVFDPNGVGDLPKGSPSVAAQRANDER
jgi:hypothetical protein